MVNFGSLVEMKDGSWEPLPPTVLSPKCGNDRLCSPGTVGSSGQGLVPAWGDFRRQGTQASAGSRHPCVGRGAREEDGVGQKGVSSCWCDVHGVTRRSKSMTQTFAFQCAKSLVTADSSWIPGSHLASSCSPGRVGRAASPSTGFEERVEKGVARAGEPANSSAAWVLHTRPASSRASRMVPNGRGKPGGLGQLCFCSQLHGTAGLKARCFRERLSLLPERLRTRPHIQRASLLRPWGELGSPADVLQLSSVCPKLRKGPQSECGLRCPDAGLPPSGPGGPTCSQMPAEPKGFHGWP